jgi:uncharacterized protein
VSRGGTFRTRPLSRRECNEILERGRIGRLAFSFRDRVDIRPLTYLYRDGWLFGRTQAGEKLESLGHHRWVAFQVDDIRGPWDWVSVVVHGAFHLFPSDAEGEEARVRAEALQAFREEVPDAFSPEDPGRLRNLLFGIAVQEVVGLRGWLERDESTTG